MNLARTYGQTYSGGSGVFGGTDSSGIYQELFEEPKKKGQEIFCFALVRELGLCPKPQGIFGQKK